VLLQNAAQRAPQLLFDTLLQQCLLRQLQFLLLLGCIWCAASVCCGLCTWRTYATRAEAVEDSYFQVGGSLRDFCGQQYRTAAVHRRQYRRAGE
jgi:hypothetical protein